MRKLEAEFARWSRKELDAFELAAAVHRFHEGPPIYQAAQHAGIAPRRFSYTRVRNAINVYGPKIAAAKSGRKAKELVALMSHYIAPAKMYPRKKKRSSYPSEVWPNAKPFPGRKARS